MVYHVYGILSYTYVHLLVFISYVFVQCTVMDHLKLINVQQVKTIYMYANKNTKEKSLTKNAAI